jgi:transcriptional regulator with XRE-family HTH domain
MAKNKKGMVWLRNKMAELNYTSLEQVAADIGINRGNLYRYFTLETKPSVAMLPVLCEVLNASYDEVLTALDCI